MANRCLILFLVSTIMVLMFSMKFIFVFFSGDREDLLFTVGGLKLKSKFENITDHEFEKTYLMSSMELGDCRDFNVSCVTSNSNNTYNLRTIPLRFDWRDYGVVGPVHNQRSCQACWAFAAAGIIESAIAIKYKRTTPNLSVQQFIDCTDDGGCSARSLVEPLKYICKTSSLLTYEKLYPTTLADEKCKCGLEDKCRRGVKLKHFNIGCAVPEEEILHIIVNYGPVAAAVNANPFKRYIGGIIEYNCDSSIVNHAVQIVGYDLTANPPYYIVKNSWGKDFGNEGFMRIAFGRNLCAIGSHIGYVLV